MGCRVQAIGDEPAGSVDMGNVSVIAPSIHSFIAISSGRLTPHSAEFAAAAASDAGSYDIQVTSDSAGGAVVVWQVNPTSATTGAFKGGRIYAQRLSPTGEQLWPEAIRVYENPSLKSQGYSSVVSDSAGGIIISSIVGKGDWPDLVYAQRIDPSGNRLWEAEGIRLKP